MLISPSGVMRFLECPEKFWLSTECKPLPLKTPAMEFGYDLHQIIAEYYKLLMRSNNVTPAELEAKLAVAARKRGVSEQMYNKYKWHFRNFINFEYERISWHVDIKPVAVEKKFRKAPFYGIVDAIFRKDDGYIIVDWKSGSSYGDELSDYYRIQGCIYKYITGIDEMAFYFLKNGTYKRVKYDDCQKVADKVKKVVESVRKGVRYRVEGKHCKMCEFQIACLHNRLRWWLDDAYWIEQAIEGT